MAGKPANYDLDVFINCPFDKKYRPIFEAIIFAVHYCGFQARYALESDNVLDNRFAKIVKIIGECKYSIHDISRTETSKIGSSRYPRFNMPLELGVFLGAGHLATTQWMKDKCCLILDKDQFRYRNFISDLSGQDIRAHHSKPERAIHEVTAWLRVNTHDRKLPGGDKVLKQYQAFCIDLPKMGRAVNMTRREMEVPDVNGFITEWLALTFPHKKK